MLTLNHWFTPDKMSYYLPKTWYKHLHNSTAQASGLHRISILSATQKQQVSGGTEKEKDKREGSEKRKEWMSNGEGSKFTEIKDWLGEKERAMNFLPSVSTLLGWCYVRAECTHIHTHTHRLPPLGGTHNMRRNLTVCESVCVCVCVCGLVRGYMRVNIHLSYISRTNTRIIETAYIQTIVLIQKGSDHSSKV